jgi:methionine sulfoxide reductase heme-binding subunit
VTSNQTIRWVLKPAAFLSGLVPAAWLAWALYTGNLSANPLGDLTNETGVWTLRFLCITLLITPLRRLTGSNWTIRFRRMAGLFAFFYGTLHFLTYSVFDRLLGLIDFPQGIVSMDTARRLSASIGEDVYKRPFITVGFTAFVLMLPLALTSTSGMIRRLGGRRWQALHRLVYVSAIAGVTHYWWLVKSDIRPPLMYALIVGLLLSFRLAWARTRRTVPSGSRPVARPRPKPTGAVSATKPTAH